MFERDEHPDPAPVDLDDGAPIHCRVCDLVVASEAAVFGVGDRPSVSTFFNPAGELMEVLTLRAAPGLREVGSPSSEFSWFPGTAWCIGACRGCSIQLGWTWRGGDPSLFCGLLTDRIRRP